MYMNQGERRTHLRIFDDINQINYCYLNVHLLHNRWSPRLPPSYSNISVPCYDNNPTKPCGHSAAVHKKKKRTILPDPPQVCAKPALVFKLALSAPRSLSGAAAAVVVVVVVATRRIRGPWIPAAAARAMRFPRMAPVY